MALYRYLRTDIRAFRRDGLLGIQGVREEMRKVRLMEREGGCSYIRGDHGNAGPAEQRCVLGI